MASFKNWQSEMKLDTGISLIFRISDILKKIEFDCERGDLESWDRHIGRIFNNVMFKAPGEVVKNEQGEIIDFHLTKEDMEIFGMFNRNIFSIRKAMIEARRDGDREELQLLNLKYHSTINKKDLWIRKLLFKLDLYLQRAEHDPSKAIYGG